MRSSSTMNAFNDWSVDSCRTSRPTIAAPVAACVESSAFSRNPMDHPSPAGLYLNREAKGHLMTSNS